MDKYSINIPIKKIEIIDSKLWHLYKCSVIREANTISIILTNVFHNAMQGVNMLKELLSHSKPLSFSSFI